MRQVTLVEWLTRGPANKLGRAFGRVGSNPAGDVKFLLYFFFLDKILTFTCGTYFYFCAHILASISSTIYSG